MSAATQQGVVRTPLLLQMEAVECGAAALGIVLAHHGLHVSLPELRRECGISRDGSKASNIVKAARGFGMEAKGYKKTLQTIGEVKLPAIVFWGFNHFVVLEGFKGGRAYLNDPANGRRVVSMDEFDKGFTGVVLVMEPGPGFQRGGEPPSVVTSLGRNLRGSYAALAFCVLAGFLGVIPTLALPVLAQVFVDNVLIEARTAWVVPLLAGMVAAVAVAGLLDLLQLKHLRELRVKLALSMSSRFLMHVLRLPISYFTQRYSGEIANRIELNDRVAQLLSGRLATTAIDATMLFFYAALMLWYDWVLTLVGVGAALLNVLGLRLAARTRVDANMQVLQEEGKLGGVAIAGLQSMETIKASAMEAGFFSRWSGHYAKAMNASQSLALTNKLLGLLPRLLGSVTGLLVLVLGGLRVMDGAMTIGMLIAFQAILYEFNKPISTLVSMLGRLQTLRGDLFRLDDVLEHPIEPTLELERTGDVGVRLEGFVELREVTFGYSPLDPPLIDNLSLTISPGQRVALVGHSGSGKSTIARLLAGLQQPWTGEVLLDGKALELVPRHVLASSLALVEQEEFFFPGSVRDNLTLWDPTIDDARLERATRDAAIHDAILSLPGGFGAELLEGAVNLSGGQRQRLEIARALVRDPTVLIMDEATSGLDAETELEIDRGVRMRGCATLVVAHRLSTIRDCDEILVLSKGEVVERGTYDELKLMGGEFSALLQELVGEEDEASD